MKIPCPLCGPRDRREFYYYGSPDYLDRISDGADLDALDNQLFLRDNIAGDVQDLWYHEAGCTAWLKVSRSTITHAVTGAVLVMHPPNAAPIAAQQKTGPAMPTNAAKAGDATKAQPASKSAAKPAAKPALKPLAKPAAKPAAKTSKPPKKDV